MSQINDLLEARVKQLLQLKKKKEKALSNCPEGFLRISHHGNRTQYYRRNDPKDFNGVYIPQKNIHIARKLAQKDYDQKVIQAVEKELKAIEKYRSNYSSKKVEEIYEGLHKERQKLIVPVMETDEEYIRKWEGVEYQGKAFYDNAPEYFSAKGERVRSKSEVIIADLLGREGVPYRYEYPLQLKGGMKIYPDFTVLNVKKRQELIWEHLGMLDNSEYAELFVQKMASYAKNGFFSGDNLILTYETSRSPINQKMILTFIYKYLK